MATAETHEWIELADRAGDGLDVRLLWKRPTSDVRVTVRHVRTGKRFALDVPGSDALDAFHHPFAYRPPRPRREPAVPARDEPVSNALG